MPEDENPEGAKQLRDPNERERAAMDRAHQRYKARPAPFEYGLEPLPNGEQKLALSHSNAAGHLIHSLDTFGTASDDFKDNALMQLGAVIQEKADPSALGRQFNAALAAVGSIAPENELEAMLAVQMVATHDLAMKTMGRMNDTSDPDKMDKLCTIATKMLRTYTTQVEALAKLRRGGAQTVRVEHVHVYQGGQAIVGNVQGGAAPRGMIENGQQPHALTGPAAHAVSPGASMLCQDPAGVGMPVTSSVGEAPVSNARRRQGKRGAVR